MKSPEAPGRQGQSAPLGLAAFPRPAPGLDPRLLLHDGLRVVGRYRTREGAIANAHSACDPFAWACHSKPITSQNRGRRNDVDTNNPLLDQRSTSTGRRSTVLVTHRPLSTGHRLSSVDVVRELHGAGRGVAVSAFDLGEQVKQFVEPSRSPGTPSNSTHPNMPCRAFPAACIAWTSTSRIRLPSSIRATLPRIVRPSLSREAHSSATPAFLLVLTWIVPESWRPPSTRRCTPGPAQRHDLRVERLADPGEHFDGEVLVVLLDPVDRALDGAECFGELLLCPTAVLVGVADQIADAAQVVVGLIKIAEQEAGPYLICDVALSSGAIGCNVERGAYAPGEMFRRSGTGCPSRRVRRLRHHGRECRPRTAGTAPGAGRVREPRGPLLLV